MDAHGVERRALTFMARNMIFIHKLHYGVTKAHDHAENYSTLDSTLKNPSSVLPGTGVQAGHVTGKTKEAPGLDALTAVHSVSM